jgi:transposase
VEIDKMEITMESATTMKPESAEKFIQDVRRKTRRKFTAEEKIRVVLEGMKREVAVTELCRREGIPTAVYYSWVKDFMEAGKARLKRDNLRDASKSEVAQLRQECDRLKILIGDKELAIQLLKKSL